MTGFVALQVSKFIQTIARTGQGHQRWQELPHNSHGRGITAQSAAQLPRERIARMQESLQCRERIRLHVPFGTNRNPEAKVHDVVGGHRELIAELPVDHAVALVVPQYVLAAKVPVRKDGGKAPAETRQHVTGRSVRNWSPRRSLSR